MRSPKRRLDSGGPLLLLRYESFGCDESFPSKRGLKNWCIFNQSLYLFWRGDGREKKTIETIGIMGRRRFVVRKRVLGTECRWTSRKSMQYEMLCSFVWLGAMKRQSDKTSATINIQVRSPWKTTKNLFNCSVSLSPSSSLHSIYVLPSHSFPTPSLVMHSLFVIDPLYLSP